MEVKERKAILRELSAMYYGIDTPVPPRTVFVRGLMKACGVSKATAYNWILGITEPKSPELLEKLRKYLEEEKS